ncbi:retrotransposon protein, putative, ty1-copia subclass [Tanacetum coccineum]
MRSLGQTSLFVGYPEESFRYLFYKPKDDVVFVARRGVFFVREMISKEDNGSKIDLEEIQEFADEEPTVNTDTQQEVVTLVEPDDIPLPIAEHVVIELDEPANCKEAMASHESAKWKEAMKSEIQSMYDNQDWNLVDTTPGLKMVGCKWIFKKKTDIDGKVHTYKARLVVKGYTQTQGIDYEETFSPLAKIKSIRIMFAIAAFHVYEIWRMDVKTAFLNEKLTKDNPGEGHWTTVKNILKYLRNTKDMFLVYGGEEELKRECWCMENVQSKLQWQSNATSEYIAACED